MSLRMNPLNKGWLDRMIQNQWPSPEVSHALNAPQPKGERNGEDSGRLHSPRGGLTLTIDWSTGGVCYELHYVILRVLRTHAQLLLNIPLSFKRMVRCTSGTSRRLNELARSY